MHAAADQVGITDFPRGIGLGLHDAIGDRELVGRQRELMARVVAASDVCITTAAIAPTSSTRPSKT